MTPFEQDVLTALNAHMECYGFVWNGPSSEHLAHDVAAAIEAAGLYGAVALHTTTRLAEPVRRAALAALRED